MPTTGSGDELDELATTLNDMVGRIRHSVERMQRFSANAAHELRTPLTALRSRLEVTLEQGAHAGRVPQGARRDGGAGGEPLGGGARDDAAGAVRGAGCRRSTARP